MCSWYPIVLINPICFSFFDLMQRLCRPLVMSQKRVDGLKNMPLLLVHWFPSYLITIESVVISEWNACSVPICCYSVLLVRIQRCPLLFPVHLSKDIVLHTLAILLTFATVADFFCFNWAAFSGIMHIWKHLEDEALCGECICLFVYWKSCNTGKTFWSSCGIQLDLIVGEWSEACMHTIRMKEN